jgi:hypothetical protein
MKPDNIIAIDPDCQKNGLCHIKKKSGSVHVDNLTFPELIEYLVKEKRTIKESGETMIVIVEASWLNGHHNWHMKTKDGHSVASSKGYDIGRNHEVGRKIVEICKFYNIPVEEVRPLKKTWKGPDGKITHEELEYFTGITKRFNQEVRDATLICWHYAGLPIKMKV